MTTTAQLLVHAYERIGGIVHEVIDGLDEAALSARIDPQANSIAWLVWHLARVQDDHVAHVAGTDQVWISHGWNDRFGLPFEATVIGYGQTSEEVGQVRGVSAESLTGYYDDVYAATTTFLDSLTDDDLDRVVDERWDPPVTLAARLISVLSDDLQHAGQAAYLRGLLSR